MTEVSDCPFEVGQEVAVLDGPDGKPLKIARVYQIGAYSQQNARYRPSGVTCIEIEGDRRWFGISPLGYSRGRGRTSRQFLAPATDEHRAHLHREGLLALIHQSSGRIKALPTPALERIVETLQAYLPGGVVRQAVPTMAKEGLAP